MSGPQFFSPSLSVLEGFVGLIPCAFPGRVTGPVPSGFAGAVQKDAWNLLDRLTGPSPLSPPAHPRRRYATGGAGRSSRGLGPVNPSSSVCRCATEGRGKKKLTQTRPPKTRFSLPPLSGGGMSRRRRGDGLCQERERFRAPKRPGPACGAKRQARDCLFRGGSGTDFHEGKIWAWKARTDFLFRLPGSSRTGCVIQYGDISSTLTTTGRAS